MLEFIREIKKEVPADDSVHEGEHFFLYGLIRALRPAVVVETGTHKGLTSLYMTHALFDNRWGILHTIDPKEWGAPGNFRKFPELEELITFHVARGDEVEIEEEIDFLFLDGLHEYEEVTSEMKHLLPKLSDRGVVAFHDAGGDNASVGVRQAVSDAKLNAILIPTYNNIILYSKANYADINTYSNDKARWPEAS